MYKSWYVRCLSFAAAFIVRGVNKIYSIWKALCKFCTEVT